MFDDFKKMNCSHCSSFALFEQFTWFAVRTVRYFRKQLLLAVRLFGLMPNSVREYFLNQLYTSRKASKDYGSMHQFVLCGGEEG